MFVTEPKYELDQLTISLKRKVRRKERESKFRREGEGVKSAERFRLTAVKIEAYKNRINRELKQKS